MIASHTLEVNVVCHKGIESGGNEVIPLATAQPEEHVIVAALLCPAIKICDDDRYQNTVPVVTVPDKVAVTGAVIENIAVPVRI